MNNKGFIATSLIYSFFLIFITLFLTIIADYLQNKVLLNTIENGIKDNINNTKSIEDFEVGDIINLSISGQPENGTGIYGMPNSSMWIIANISFDNKDTPDDESSIVLYNLKAEQTIVNGDYTVSATTIKKDLENTINYNATRVIELLKNSNDNYILPGITEKVYPKCSKINLTDAGLITINNDASCTTTPEPNTYRERKTIDDWNNKKVKILPAAMGGFTITGEA